MLNPHVKDAVPTISYPELMEPIETMGDRIRQLRVARGYTQEQFGKLVGVTKSAVSQWEDGSTKNLKMVTFLTVVEVLQTDVNYIIYGKVRGPSARTGKRSPKVSNGT